MKLYYTSQNPEIIITSEKKKQKITNWPNIPLPPKSRQKQERFRNSNLTNKNINFTQYSQSIIESSRVKKVGTNLEVLTITIFKLICQQIQSLGFSPLKAYMIKIMKNFQTKRNSINNINNKCQLQINSAQLITFINCACKMICKKVERQKYLIKQKTNKEISKVEELSIYHKTITQYFESFIFCLKSITKFLRVILILVNFPNAANEKVCLNSKQIYFIVLQYLGCFIQYKNQEYSVNKKIFIRQTETQILFGYRQSPKESSTLKDCQRNYISCKRQLPFFLRPQRKHSPHNNYSLESNKSDPRYQWKVSTLKNQPSFLKKTSKHSKQKFIPQKIVPKKRLLNLKNKSQKNLYTLPEMDKKHELKQYQILSTTIQPQRLTFSKQSQFTKIQHEFQPHNFQQWKQNSLGRNVRLGSSHNYGKANLNFSQKLFRVHRN